MSQNFNRNSTVFHLSNNNWHTNFSQNSPFLFSITIFLIYAVVFLTGVVANIFVIVTIIKRRRMRTLTNRFLLNLAISDLIATFVCLPPTAYHYYDKRWIFGEFLCRFVPFMQGTTISVSIFTLMAVSIDRFIAIQKPIHSKLLCTPTRVIITILIIWIGSFILMIPVILHHRLVDPLDITLTACAEDWHQNMNARLVYDFILLIVLFILPLTLMTYCYVRISLSLWFIDSNVQSSTSSSIINAARFSTISEDSPNDIRQNIRPIYVCYHKINDNNLNRQQTDDYRSLLTSNQSQRSTGFNAQNSYNHSSKLLSRRFSDDDYRSNTNPPQVHIHERPVRQRHSISQYTCGIQRPSITSIPSSSRTTSGNNQQRRSIVDFEHASRFIRSRRRIVKLLITLIIVFFVTRLPSHILSIYIDTTSNTYLPENTFTNRTTFGDNKNTAALYESYLGTVNRKMFVVNYVNPIFQLFSLSNSAINPLCYCVMSHTVKHIFTVMQQKIRRSHKKTSSFTLVQ